MKRIILLSLAVLATASCNGSGPQVDVCLSFPQNGGFVCVDRNQKAYFIAYAESLKYVAFNPSDAQTLISSCGLSGHSKMLVQTYLKRVEKVAIASTK